MYGNESLQDRNFLLRRPAHKADRVYGFISPVGTETDKGEFLVTLRFFFRYTQRVQLIVAAALLLYFFAVVQAVKLIILEVV